MKLNRWWRENLRREQLERCAGRRVYERGNIYWKTGRVMAAQLTETELNAQVQGTLLYAVRLWRRNSQLQTACDCPYASEGAFCKHAVAAALAITPPENENDLPAEDFR